jgi:hypothetical protein
MNVVPAQAGTPFRFMQKPNGAPAFAGATIRKLCVGATIWKLCVGATIWKL